MARPAPPLPPEVLADVTDLLAACPAFGGVPRGDLERLTRAARIGRVAGSTAPLSPALVVMRGGVYVQDAQGRTLEVVATGEYAAPAEGETLQPAEPTLVVWLPDEARDLAWTPTARARPAAVSPGVDWESTSVRQVMRSPVQVVDAAATCREVAGVMRDHGISSVLVAAGGSLGIATDRDLRTRLVAEGLSPETPVGAIATVPARTVPADTPVFEALLQMLGSGIHHLPVAERGRVVGMLSSGDLNQLDARNPLAVRVALDRADSVAAVRVVLAGLPDTVAALLAGGSAASAVGRVVATVTDRVHQRLLALAFADLGQPPTDYGWLVFGSQARHEQTLHTDQDTGLLLPDDLTADEAAWWQGLAERMTADLEVVGYPRCPGGVMATNDQWRLGLTGWRSRLHGLVHEPSEEHLLESAIVFDQRTVAGALDATVLLRPAVAAAHDEQVFLGRLARASVAHRTPLGFLGRFAVERGGEHRGRFDVKAGVLLPITDLARLATLARGGIEVATLARLEAAVEAEEMSADLGTTLAAGYELALGLRLRHHVAQHRRGHACDDWLDPAEVTALDRSLLRETFKAVRTAQEFLALRYRTSLIG